MRFVAPSLAAGVLLALVSVTPASSEPNPIGTTTTFRYTMDARKTWNCLDSSNGGSAYVRKCQSGNDWMAWKWLDAGGGFYKLQNKATQLCLARKGDDIGAVTCSNDRNQDWGASFRGERGVSLFNRANSRYLATNDRDLFWSPISSGQVWQLDVVK